MKIAEGKVYKIDDRKTILKLKLNQKLRGGDIEDLAFIDEVIARIRKCCYCLLHSTFHDVCREALASRFYFYSGGFFLLNEVSLL